MKIGICGDLHFGVKLDSERFVKYQKNAFDTMINHCIDNDISSLVFLGDILNNRRSISIKVLDYLVGKFKEASKKINMNVLVGNHDVFYKNTNHLNSLEIIFDPDIFDDEHYRSIGVFSQKPVEYTIGGKLFLFVPWITKDNYEECIERIKNSSAHYCLGHFEINGFLMNSFIKCKDGLTTKDFESFKRVFSGHFHTRSQRKNIMYVGSMTQITWNDYGDDRGFYILDTETDEVEFIQLNEPIFQKLVIGDNDTIESFLSVKDKYIKVYINRKLSLKEQKILTDILLQNIKYEVIDNTIIDDSTDLKVTDETTDVIIKEGVDIQENLTDDEKRDVYELIMGAYNELLLEEGE